MQYDITRIEILHRSFNLIVNMYLLKTLLTITLPLNNKLFNFFYNAYICKCIFAKKISVLHAQSR